MVTLTKPVKRMATRQTQDHSPPVPSCVEIPTSEVGMVNPECPKRPFSVTHASGRLFAVNNDHSRTIQGRTWPRHRLSQTLHRSWPVEKGVLGGKIWTEKNPLALQEARTAGLGRSDSPLGSFKHTEGGQPVLWAHTHTPNGHLPRTGGSSASEAKVTAFVAVLVTNASVHGSRLCRHQ